MIFSDDTYEVGLNSMKEKGIVNVTVTYFDTSEHLKPKKKNIIIDFNNDLIIQGDISKFIVDYYLPSRKEKEKK